MDAVLEAAAQVLEAEGYDALTTTRVAERAGVSVGTLYQYFPDKAAVVAGLVEARLGREVRAVQAAFAEAEALPLGEAADRVVGTFVGLFEPGPKQSAAVLHGALRVRWRPLIDDLLDGAVEAVAGRLSDRGHSRDDALTAHVAVHAVVGITVRALVDRPADVASGAVRREAQAVVRRYLAGEA